MCRAYADWNRSDVGEWVGSMPREGLHSFHHFADDDDQALVAMALDAVDIARDAAVDEVVIAGDLTSSLPSGAPPARGRSPGRRGRRRAHPARRPGGL